MFNLPNHSARTYRSPALVFTRSALLLTFAVLLAVSPSATAQTAHLSSGTQNFGSANVGTASAPATLTFTFDTAGTLGSTSVVTQGATGLDFTDAGTGSCAAGTSYAAGTTCTINVTFTPRFLGTRYGAAMLIGGSGLPFATGYLQGAGTTAPQVNFSPFGIEIFRLENYGPGQLAIDAGDDLYFNTGVEGRGIVKVALPPGGLSLSTFGSGLSAADEIAVDGAGNLFIADNIENKVYEETPSPSGYTQSTLPFNLGAYGGGPNSITGGGPTAIAVDGSGNIYLANANLLEETLKPDGSYTQSVLFPVGDSGGPVYFEVAVDGSGSVYTQNEFNGQILKETLSGGSYTQSVIGSLQDNVVGEMAADSLGNVYLAAGGPVAKLTPSANGYLQSTLPADSTGVAVDGAGNVFLNGQYNGPVSDIQILEVAYALPPNLSFAATYVGSTSADSPQTVTVENVGTAPLTFPVPESGNNPSASENFILSSGGSSPCPILSAVSPAPWTLAAGASCTLSVSYAPSASLPLTGTLVFTDNNLSASGPGYASQTAALTAAKLPIFPAKLTVLANSLGITYGQAPGPLTYSLHGFLDGDNLSVVSGAPILSTTVTSTTPRGNYPIDVEVGTLSAANYRISTIGPQGGTGAVRVYKAPLTVTANTVTMTEGGAVPPLTYAITGFVNGEDVSVVSGSALLSTTVTSSTHVGEYFITVDVGPLSAENYYFVPAVHGGVVKVAK